MQAMRIHVPVNDPEYSGIRVLYQKWSIPGIPNRFALLIYTVAGGSLAQIKKAMQIGISTSPLCSITNAVFYQAATNY